MAPPPLLLQQRAVSAKPVVSETQGRQEVLLHQAPHTTTRDSTDHTTMERFKVKGLAQEDCGMSDSSGYSSSTDNGRQYDID